MRILPCLHCGKNTQHIIFSEQVQCQRCGKGTKKAKSSPNLKDIPQTKPPITVGEGRIGARDKIGDSSSQILKKTSRSEE